MGGNPYFCFFNWCSSKNQTLKKALRKKVWGDDCSFKFCFFIIIVPCKVFSFFCPELCAKSWCITTTGQFYTTKIYALLEKNPGGRGVEGAEEEEGRGSFITFKIFRTVNNKSKQKMQDSLLPLSFLPSDLPCNHRKERWQKLDSNVWRAFHLKSNNFL